MPKIKGNAKAGQPIIRVALIPALPAPSSVSPASDTLGFKGLDCRALLDTGADGTSVSRQVAEVAGLARLSKVLVTGIGGPEYKRSWAAYLGIYDSGSATTLPYVFDEPLLAVEMRPYPAFEVIIGRDILLKGSFTLRPNGDFEWDIATNP